MSHTFDICIDESGDDGFSFENAGCTRWFILSAAVVIRKNLPTLDQMLIDLKREFFWKERKPLHFRDLKDHKRRIAIERFATAGRLFRGVSVMVHKPSLADPETFQEKHRLYFYFTRFLLERASWLCRDAVTAKKPEFGDGTARIVLSNRNDLPYGEMLSYLRRLRDRGDTNIEWGSIDVGNLVTLTNGKHSGLQVADAIASAFYCADHHRGDLCCSEWATKLKPVMYCRHGKYRGFGVKIFPAEAEKQIAQGALAPWARDVYPL